MRILVIHPNDPSTQFLCRLYEDLPNVTKLTEKNSNSEITEALQHGNYELYMFLGHGGEDGLYAPNGSQQFGRHIINSGHVQFMRDKNCFGVWCNANIFASKYNLTGLFTGMVVSDANEALDYCLDFEGEDIKLLNEQYASDMEYCLRNYPLARVPKIMKEVQDYASPIKDFNYSSLHYYE